MAGSGEGPSEGARAARGVASPPTTPAVLSGTASRPVISRELRRLRRLLWSSGLRSPCVGEDKSLPSPPSCLATVSMSDSSAEGPVLDAVLAALAATGVVHSPPGLAARGAALARLDSPTPARSSGDACQRNKACGACAVGGAWCTRSACVARIRRACRGAHVASVQCTRSGHGLYGGASNQVGTSGHGLYGGAMAAP